jgi:hypothetical protein
LVAAEISGEETLKELKILAGLHGIGVIHLTVDNSSESFLAIPAQEKSTIDWHTVNRIAKENKDFLDFVPAVRKFYQTDDPSVYDWDA